MCARLQGSVLQAALLARLQTHYLSPGKKKQSLFLIPPQKKQSPDYLNGDKVDIHAPATLKHPKTPKSRNPKRVIRAACERTTTREQHVAGSLATALRHMALVASFQLPAFSDVLDGLFCVVKASFDASGASEVLLL